MIDRRTLEQVGNLLFGRNWRAAFEDCFEINNRSLRRMLSGEQPVPAGLAHDMSVALRDHGTKLDELLEVFNDLESAE